MTQADVPSAQILDAVRATLPGPGPLHEPVLGEAEKAAAADCIESGWISYAGAYVSRFEDALKETTGAKHAIAMASGTAALQLALIAAGVQPGDEVLVPGLTFVAGANAVVHAGAVPHFVDVDEATLGVDVAALRAYLEASAERRDGAPVNKATGRRIAALTCMHTFGHPSDVAGLYRIAEDFGLPFVEDAAESLGSFAGGTHTGLFGLAGTLSFNGNKTVTTGGGGAVITDDDDVAATLRHLSTTAKVPHKWEFIHDAVGYNHRLPALNAAVGVAQMQRLPGFLARKRALAARYADAFAAVPGVRLVTERDGTRANYWLNTLIMDADDIDARDRVLAVLNDAGFGSRPAWRPMHMLAPFADAPRAPLPVTEQLYRRIVSLPSGVALCPEAETADA